MGDVPVSCGSRSLRQDPESEEFAFEVFATGGPQSGFASPDNLAFDNDGNPWVVTDISSSSLGDDIYGSSKNNGAFVMPGGAGGDAFRFVSGTTEAELIGPFFTPSQHALPRHPAPR